MKLSNDEIVGWGAGLVFLLFFLIALVAFGNSVLIEIRDDWCFGQCVQEIEDGRP